MGSHMSQVPATLTLPLEPLLVLHQLEKAGFAGYIVGGAVRDIVRGNTDWLLIDFDLTTNATPQELVTIFPEAFYENMFGTVSITYQHIWEQLQIDQEYQQARELIATAHQTRKTDPKVIDLIEASKIHRSLTETEKDEELEPPSKAQFPLIEITTFRSGEKYTEGARRPSEVQWGHSLIEDLQRRDFTINALALKIPPAFLTKVVESLEKNPPTIKGVLLEAEQFEIIDHHHGMDDLSDKIIKTVGTASERIAEDALRMLRAIRFAVQLEFAIDPELLAAITSNAALLADVSQERIRDEFFKMLTSPQPKRAIELLDETGLLPAVLPELLAMKGVEQGGHHTTDVWEHSLDALAACPSPDPIVRLATLLHDVSKPETVATKGDQPTFYNHEIVGSRVAKKVGQRLRLSKRDCERLFILVRHHMFHYQPENSDAAIRRFMRKVGLENIDDILDLREADRLGSGARKTSWRLEEMKERMVEQLNQPLDLTDLAINGHDLMEHFSLKPGPQIGQILNELFEIIIEHPEQNTRESLFEIVKKKLAEN